MTDRADKTDRPDRRQQSSAATSSTQHSTKRKRKPHDESSVDSNSEHRTNIGYPPSVPKRLLPRMMVPIMVQAERIYMLRVNKALIVLHPGEAPESPKQLESGDAVCAIDGKIMNSRNDLMQYLVNAVAPVPYSMIFEIYRPIRAKAINNEQLIKTYIPSFIDIQPGYTYHRTYLYGYAGMKLGLRVKTFNGRVHVFSVKQGSPAEGGFVIGDVILSIDQDIVTSVSQLENMIGQILKDKKYCQCLVERAESEMAMRYIKAYLHHSNPKVHMEEDVQAICQQEIERMKQAENMKAMKSVLRETERSSNNDNRVQICETTTEVPIKCDPVNLKFLQWSAAKQKQRQDAKAKDFVNNSQKATKDDESLKARNKLSHESLRARKKLSQESLKARKKASEKSSKAAKLLSKESARVRKKLSQESIKAKKKGTDESSITRKKAREEGVIARTKLSREARKVKKESRRARMKPSKEGRTGKKLSQEADTTKKTTENAIQTATDGEKSIKAQFRLEEPAPEKSPRFASPMKSLKKRIKKSSVFIHNGS